MNRTKIPYCDFTWNPTTGCTKGCDCGLADTGRKGGTQHARPQQHLESLHGN